LFLSHQTGLYTPFGCQLAKEAAGFGLDNDPYSDVPIDPPIKVVVPGCSGLGEDGIRLEFPRLDYNNAVYPFWYDLEAPTELSATYLEYADNPSGANYHREHIYEVQLLAHFIGWLQRDPDSQQIWNYDDNDFCGWVNEFIHDDGNDGSLTGRLLRCLPNNENPYPNDGPFMPWLERRTNGIKARAWGGVAIYDPHKFADFSDDKKVSVMRATAGLKSYMSEPVVTYSWEMQSECVRALWGEWKEDYETNDNVPDSAKQVDIFDSYDRWIQEEIEQYNSGLYVGMRDMISWWNDNEVHLNYPNMLDEFPDETEEVTGQGLWTMWDDAGGPFAPLLNNPLVIQ